MGEAKRRKADGSHGAAGRNRRRRGWMLGGAVVLGGVLLVGLLYWLTNPKLAPLDDLPQAENGRAAFPQGLDRYGVSLGEPDAPVVVREFADYQCPACARFDPVLQRFKREYVETGRARIVYFDLPLPQHGNAMPAAMAAHCAGDQDAFWPMHAMLFERQASWAESDAAQALFGNYAEELGLDGALFERCLASERHRQRIERSAQVARQLRVAATPTVFVGDVQLTQPGWYQLAGVTERELEAAP